jgi:hypothetical protein
MVSGGRADEQLQAFDDAGDPQVIMILPSQPLIGVAIKAKHPTCGQLRSVRHLLIVPDYRDLGAGQDRRIGLGGASGRQREQPLNIIVNIFELLIRKAEHVRHKAQEGHLFVSGVSISAAAWRA